MLSGITPATSEISNEDLDIINNNKKIKNNAIRLCGLFIVGITALSLIILLIKKIFIPKIFGLNLLLLLSVGVMEFLFATYFVVNFRNIDINNVVYDILAVHQLHNPNLINSRLNPMFPQKGYYYNKFWNKKITYYP
jgi:hypothetical protein